MNLSLSSRSFRLLAVGMAFVLVAGLVVYVWKPWSNEGSAVKQTIEKLAAAGIAVYEDDLSRPIATPAEPVSPLRLLRSHAMGLSGDLARGSGISAVELDAMIPPETVEGFEVRASVVIRAWAEETHTPAARQARELLARPEGWAAEVDDDDLPVFSTLVMILFFSDLATIGASLPGIQGSSDEPSPLLSRHQIRTAGFFPAAVEVPGTLCSSTVQFVHDAVGAAFDAIHNLLTPPQVNTGWGLFDDIANVVIGAVFAAVDWVVTQIEILVQGAVSVLISDVMSVVAKIAGIVGTIAEVANRLKPWTVTIDSDPERIESKGLVGLVTLSVTTDWDEWPAWMMDCAAVAGRPLPSLRPEGSPVQWHFSSIRALPDPTGGEQVLNSDANATYRYATVQQEETCHVGEENIYVSATVNRNDVEDLNNLMMGLFESGVDAIPGLGTIGALRDVVNTIAKPLVESALREASALLPTFRSTPRHLYVPLTYWRPGDDCEEDEPDLATPIPVNPVQPGGPGGPRPTTPQDPGNPGDGDEPEDEEDEPEDPPCGEECALSVGDPHLLTVDGHYYQFHAAGEFVLLRSEDRTFEVQIRYQRFPSPIYDISAGTALAARMGPHVVTWYMLEGGVYIDGEPLEVGPTADLGEHGRVRATRDGVLINFANGARLYTSRFTTMIDPSDELRGRGQGLVGTVQPGGLAVPPLPDGTVLPTPANRDEHISLIYDRLAPAWRVTAADSLFSYAEGQSPDTYHVLDYPARDRVPLTLRDLDASPELRAAGEEACAAVEDPRFHEMCLFDFTVTANPEWVDSYTTAELVIKHGRRALIDPGSIGEGGTPSLVLTGSLMTNSQLLQGGFGAPPGTVVVVRATSCPTGLQGHLNVRLSTVDDRQMLGLCGDPRPIFPPPGDDDELYQTEAYSYLGIGGQYEIQVSVSQAQTTPIELEIEVYVDPTPTVVRATGDDLRAFSGQYRLTHIADTVVFALSRPDGIVHFSNLSGFGPGGACGSLELGGPDPGDLSAGIPLWPLWLCRHTDIARVGYMISGWVVPFVAFNRTNTPIDVTLGPPG